MQQDQRLLLAAMEKTRELERKKKPKFPHLDNFTGDRTKFRHFETQVKLKFLRDAQEFSDGKEKIFYIIGRLQGEPAE